MLIGGPRQLACFPDFPGEKRLLASSPAALAGWLAAHRDRSVVVLASGDPMLYGIGDYLSRHLAAGMLHIVPGISAVQYLFSRLGLAMNEVYLAAAMAASRISIFILQHAKWP